MLFLTAAAVVAVVSLRGAQRPHLRHPEVRLRASARPDPRAEQAAPRAAPAAAGVLPGSVGTSPGPGRRSDRPTRAGGGGGEGEG